MTLKRTLLGAFLVAALGAAAYGVNYANQVASIGAGFMARDTCNEVFIAGRDVDDVLENDFQGYDDTLELVSVDVDLDTKTARAGIGPLGRSKAIYRDGYGCTLSGPNFSALPSMPPIVSREWLVALPSDHGFDEDALNAALDKVFENPTPNHRALAIFRHGKLAAERYAPGFDKNTPMLSFSMAKSVSGMMVGAAVEKGFFTLDDRPPIDEWSAPDDPRRDITWRDLMQMQSGLEFQEEYLSPLADVPVMNILEDSAAAYAINKPLAHPPGTHWQYSTGTSNILQGALRVALEQNDVDYHLFGRNEIFEPLGMSSAVFVPDRAGDFIGGSYLYATARDWAKLGQLHIQDGVWNGTRILPEGWSKFVSSPASASRGYYGGQIWLNLPRGDEKKKFFPTLPDSTYWFSGWRGQIVAMVPSQDIVIVNLGRASATGDELKPFNAALELIIPTLRLEADESG
ncbi:MAG: serine hydrolase [Pseudomonadota bacterium]